MSSYMDKLFLNMPLESGRDLDRTARSGLHKISLMNKLKNHIL